MRQVVEVWGPVAAEHQIDLGVEVARDLPDVAADEEKLRRVLDNLVKNAVEAVVRGPGRVALTANPTSAAMVRIGVEDTGPGIPENLRLFRLFETTKRNGSGLGLSIARQIVLAHGGEITFERLRPHGTGFYVDLPLRPAVSGHPRRADPRAVASAATSFAAEVAILDYEMPGMNGLALADALHDAHPDLPILLVMAYTTRDLKDAIGTRRFIRLRRKSLDYDTLHDAVHELAAGRGGRPT